MASDSRNLHRIHTELGFLEDTLTLQPENKPEHLGSWDVWLRGMDKQWASLVFSAPPPLLSNSLFSTSQGEYRTILKSVGFQEAPTGELLEREQRALGRKKEAEIIYDRLHEAVRASKGLHRLGSGLGSTEDVDYSAMVNDSTDAEGEPDTTTSAPAIATEKANGEKTQMLEPQGESKAKTSPVPEVSAITFWESLRFLTSVFLSRIMMNSRSVVAHAYQE
jgi:hypothetical protein